MTRPSSDTPLIRASRTFSPRRGEKELVENPRPAARGEGGRRPGEGLRKPAAHPRHENNRLRNRELVFRPQFVFPLQVPRGALLLRVSRAREVQLADIAD